MTEQSTQQINLGSENWIRALRTFGHRGGSWASVFVAVLIVYYPALHGGMLWDDDVHVTRPELQTLSGLKQIWFKLGATQQYYPVLHSAFWIEHRLWGDRTLGYHLVNILLHATAACLLGAVVGRISPAGGRAREAGWLAALLVALHPVGVESVAWISEQKNTLSAVFYLLAGLVYISSYGRARVGPGGNLWRYGLATTLFVLAILTKSVTATLPAALLVALWWRNGRLSVRRDVAPLLPWFAMAAAAGVLTTWVEARYIGAHGAAFDLGFFERCLLAGRVIWFYVGKLLWPANLTFIYPRWDAHEIGGRAGLFLLGVLLALALAWRARRRRRGPLAAGLFFVGTLFPALGFINVYPFLFSYVADHFQYLASFGMFAGAAAILLPARGPWPIRAAAFALLPAAGLLTYRQCEMYRDVGTLYRVTIARNPDCWLAYNNLGVASFSAGRLAESVDEYHRAIQLNPSYPDAQLNLGLALAAAGRPAEAIAAYEKAIALQPAFAKAQNALGVALARQGRFEEAGAHYKEAQRIRPDIAETYNNLGIAATEQEHLGAAVEFYEQALRLDPNYFEAQYNLGLALFGLERPAEAVAHYAIALRINPDAAEVHESLGVALGSLGQLREATRHLARAVALRPEVAEFHYNLGVTLHTAGRDAESGREMEMAKRLGMKARGAPRP